jgi:uroporphyrinogen decarboxylase
MAYDGVRDDFAACVSGEGPRRLPVFALGLEFDLQSAGVTCAESRMDVAKTVGATVGAVERFGYDWAMVFPDDYVEFEPLGLVMRHDRDTPAMPERYLPLVRETLGGFRIPDAGKDLRLPVHLEMIRRVKEELGESVLVAGRIAAPFSALALVYGMDAALTGMLLEPDLVRDNMRFFVEHQIAFGQAQFDAGADLLWLGDCVAASNFISAAHYEAFALGPANEVASALSGEGRYLVYHAAETSTDHIRLEVQLAVDAVNLGEGVSIAAVKGELAPDRCLMGNFDPILLRDGTPEAVARETRAMMTENLAGGGYLFNTGEGITPDTPPENVHAMMEAARECASPDTAG